MVILWVSLYCIYLIIKILLLKYLNYILIIVFDHFRVLVIVSSIWSILVHLPLTSFHWLDVKMVFHSLLKCYIHWWSLYSQESSVILHIFGISDTSGCDPGVSIVYYYIILPLVELKNFDTGDPQINSKINQIMSHLTTVIHSLKIWCKLEGVSPFADEDWLCIRLCKRGMINRDWIEFL